uniref:uncharacterized protein LOC127065567 isoform X2 n=1 Tax=Vespula vulgaris TaxID=7454 RepID=UPI00223B51F6|nr:uncharacterized protein LOC127065567 isoform X2 [Vespula vulgaris]
MNLMFRKNFGVEKGAGGGLTGAGGGVGGGLGDSKLGGTYGGSVGGGGGGVYGGTCLGLGNRYGITRVPGQSVVPGRGPIRRSREFGYFPSMGDHEHQSFGYRTHLFLSPPTGGPLGAPPDSDAGERLGPSPRRNSGPHVIKWGGGGANSGTAQGPASANQTKRKQNQQSKEPSEPPTPTASRQSAPIADKKRSGSPLSILEVEDPKQCVLVHFMTPLEPLDPLVESPVSRPLVLQRDTAAELVAEIAPSASQSILLTNMEKNADFPFITYYLINKQNTDPLDFYNEVQCAALRKFDPRDLRYAASHTLDLFNEVATIARPPLEPPGGRPPIPSTGYIVSIFKVFEGDDGLKFEQNWLYWSGARMMYRYLPKSVGLRRITLHKSMSQGDKMYLLICECSQLQDNLSAAAILLPALRARLCGYIGLYRPSVCF